MRVRVYYEDTDIGGVVYYANYFKFIERARSELFFAQNKTPFEMDGHFVVQKLDANFISSAKLGDVLEVSTLVKNISRASIELHQDICKNKTTIFTCSVKLVYTDKNAKPKRIPESIVNLFADLH